MVSSNAVPIFRVITVYNESSGSNIGPIFTLNTLRPLYNTVHYNTVLDITRFKDGSQNV